MDRDTVEKVARLGRLKLTNEELDRFAGQLGSVLKYVHMLNEVDTDDVQPMAHAVELTNVLREDVTIESLPRDAALANAPLTDGKYFLVPQILDGA